MEHLGNLTTPSGIVNRPTTLSLVLSFDQGRHQEVTHICRAERRMTLPRLDSGWIQQATPKASQHQFPRTLLVIIPLFLVAMQSAMHLFPIKYINKLTPKASQHHFPPDSKWLYAVLVFKGCPSVAVLTERCKSSSSPSQLVTSTHFLNELCLGGLITSITFRTRPGDQETGLDRSNGPGRSGKSEGSKLGAYQPLEPNFAYIRLDLLQITPVTREASSSLHSTCCARPHRHGAFDGHGPRAVRCCALPPRPAWGRCKCH